MKWRPRDPNTDFTVRQISFIGYNGHEMIGFCHDSTSMPENLPPGLGDHGPPCAPFEKRDSQRVLDPRQAAAQCGDGYIESSGSTAQTMGGVENEQAMKVA
ncbi:hypothetical protein AD948_07215 [Acetobacter senegalensis]|uniref:Uncharacterized protein n=1 Tax=Acetobacter senegalensis TaxID=446692 RepID=A0A149U3I9_9PROT|nr:hypothetical protein AD948_07215 [Acetobacter senegalensis]